MHVHQRIKLRFGGLGDGCMHAHARVVDQKIKALALPMAAQGLLQMCGKGFEAGYVAHIQRQGHSAAAQRFDVCHHRLGLGGLLAVGQHHVDAAACGSQRCIAAQAPAAAGD
ncbi:hypothetical protein D3C72_1339880 [compost metagenome]